jgi:TolB protein
MRVPLRARVSLLVVASLAVVATAAVPAAAVTSGVNGKIGYQSDADGDAELYAKNPDGSGIVRLTANAVWDGDLAWSPDGNRAAFSRFRTGGACSSLGCKDLFLVNADGSGASQLTSSTVDGKGARGPSWSPDGAAIAFYSDQYGAKDVFRVSASGGAPTRLTTDAANDFSPAWSPDGSTILFVSTRTGSGQLWTMDPDGSNQRRLALSGAQVPGALIGDPAWSPDGAQIVLRGAVDQWSVTKLYVANADGSGSHVVWSGQSNGLFAYDPAWSPDGTKIAFAVDDGTGTHYDVRVLTLATGNAQQFANGSASELNPDWTVGMTSGGLSVSGTHVNVLDHSFTPATPTVGQGTTVTWDFGGVSSHTASDATGMDLYASGANGAGASYAYTFGAAGTFAFRCDLHPKTMSGSVSVPLTASPSSGGASTAFTVTWATSAPPTGLVYDVQVKRPGARQFRDWTTGVTSTSASFTPDAGPGTYLFRARLRQTSKKVSAWSPERAISVS